MPKFAIIDGHSLAHRAFFALPPLTTRDGIPTNAAYGFSLMLLRLIEVEKPDYLAVAFDRAAPTFRHEAYQAYKATRRKMPDELRGQFDIIRRILNALDIPIYELDGFEADDVIGTLASEAARCDADVLIFTGDRDAFQLINDRIHVMITRKGITEIEKVDRDELGRRYGLSPVQIPDLKGLMGDASDNIPGVPGIGEKTALRLLHEFGSVEHLLEQLDKLSRVRERELLETHAEQALASKDLATIRCNVPVQLDLERCRVSEPDRRKMASLFTDLEFHSLARRMAGDTEVNSGQAAAYQAIDHPELLRVVPGGLEPVLSAINRAGVFAIQFWSLRTAWGDVHPYGLAVAVPDKGAWWIPLEGSGAIKPEEWGRLFSTKAACWGHDLKAQFAILRHCAVDLPHEFFDTMVLSYLIDSSAAGQTLEDICRRQIAAEPGGWRDDRGRYPDPLNPGDRVPEPEYLNSSAARLGAVLALKDELSQKICSAGMLELYRDIEAPLIPVLLEMEATGVALDLPFLKKLAGEFGGRLKDVEGRIFELAGEPFNINSPKQLGTVLFERLGLRAAKKTKTGYSTDAAVLEELADAHPIVESILEYRQLAKLKSTYIDALPQLVNRHTGRVHTTFNQTVTATGRLSSTDPNLQNIPIRTEEGGRIRHAFVPGSGQWRILTADYSQIELRIMAHMSEDPVLIEAFRSGEDIHRRTAAEIFGLAPEAVDSRLRDQAKAVNFGVIYGISGFGLARGTGVSRGEADRFIQRYFERYEGVSRFVDSTIRQAREDGFVTTLFKRRRYLPDLFAANRNVRSFAERTARNTPVQGTAADLIKLAMIRVHNEMCSRRFEARMLLQVHDELVFEVPENEVTDLARLVKETMESVVELRVPLIADVKTGTNWGDAKRGALVGEPSQA